MARQVKDRWVGIRFDSATHDRIKTYVEDVEADMDMAKLARVAINEYMINHPIKDPKSRVNATKLTVPGE